MLLAICGKAAGKLALHMNDTWGERNFWAPEVYKTKDGRYAMVYNPTGKECSKEFGPRTPLTVALSNDGLHWTDVLNLEEGPGEFSYPSVIWKDKELHIVYTWNRKKIGYVRVEVIP